MASRPDLRVIQGGDQSEGPTRAESDAVAKDVIATMLSGRTPRHSSLQAAHDALTQTLGFQFTAKNQDFVLPGGYQLFYLRGNVLVRIKTVGTQRRSRPHMTISLTLRGEQGWESERAKYTSRGTVSAALLVSNPIPKMPALARINPNAAAMGDEWADDCHFDFPQPFDDSAASLLTPGG